MKEITAKGGRAQCFPCDVGSDAELASAFNEHIRAFQSLDLVCLNAGIMEYGGLLDEDEKWRETIKVNLMAVLVGVRLAVHRLRRLRSSGSILVTASAGGIFPMPLAPVYSASKAGCIALVRSLGPRLYDRYRISLNCICPQFTDTNLVRSAISTYGDAFSKQLMEGIPQMLTVKEVANAAASLLTTKDATGECLVILSNGSTMKLGKPRLLHASLLAPKSCIQDIRENQDEKRSDLPMNQWSIPEKARKVVVHTLSPDFQTATTIVSFPVMKHPPPGTILVKNIYVGVNASDVNFTSGMYQKVERHMSKQKMPFDCGFESCGLCVAVASDVSDFRPGEAVAAMVFGSFAEYFLVPAKLAIKIPRVAPEVIALLTSGLTASIALEQAARPRRGEVVLVTAAAGGTGQFFVQLAKAAGCHVVAVCGSDAKADLLIQLGADRVINYREDNVQEVLKIEYPQGIEIIFELVGGNMFDICLKAIAQKGRLVVIGAVSQYKDGWQPREYFGIAEKLLSRSASCIGFFLPHYSSHYRKHLASLVSMWQSGKLYVALDSNSKHFRGIETIPQAVHHLQSGKSIGKVYVCLVEKPLQPSQRL